jgi:NitT/TauT family transport system permease protein
MTRARESVIVVLGGVLLVAPFILGPWLAAEFPGKSGVIHNILLVALNITLMLWLTKDDLLRPSHSKRIRFFVAALFGISLLQLWEATVILFEVQPVILPAPSAIGAKIATSLPVLWQDFTQTILKGAIPGFLIGAGAAFVVAIAIDRSPFLQRGLLPVGNFVAALPIVGLAPILVMWFGFDWQSKAAVVVVMVFFPILVNLVAGLQASERMQRDLMATWGATYWQTLVKLRLPAAMPFLFNGLKIASTLALIGAIVAEFFGSPVYGMGFRISTEVGRLGLDMVWAEIAVAALAGSVLYGLITLIERWVTFWHPSQRH